MRRSAMSTNTSLQPEAERLASAEFGGSYLSNHRLQR